MTRSEIQFLRRGVDVGSMSDIEAVLLRAEHKATMRKARRLRRRFEEFARKHSKSEPVERPVIRMADYWRAAGRE